MSTSAPSAKTLSLDGAPKSSTRKTSSEKQESTSTFELLTEINKWPAGTRVKARPGTDIWDIVLPDGTLSWAYPHEIRNV